MASELSRRDPGVYVGLTGYGGSAAHADALMMTSPGGAEYQARRRGLGFTAGDGPHFEMEWDQALQMPSARAVAMALESSLGIHLPEKIASNHATSLGLQALGVNIGNDGG